MDNIGKLVLGLVAVIGLIVLMIPSGNPLEDKGPDAAQEAPQNLPPPVTEDDEDDGGVVRVPGDAKAPAPVTPSSSNAPIAFGQPMMDPTPPGQRALQEQQMQQQAQVQQQNGGTPVDDEVNSSGPAPGMPDTGPGTGY